MGEIFGLLITLAIIGIGALNQMLAKNAERRQREAARQRRQQGQPAGRGPQPQRPRPRTPEDAVEEFLRRARAEKQEEVVPVEVVEVEEVPESGGSIADHVQQYFAEKHPERDLVSVDNADEQMTEHLDEAFDDRLGSLGRGEVETVQQEKRETMADTLVGMLRSPQGMTSAIILHEILQRPKFDDE